MKKLFVILSLVGLVASANATTIYRCRFRPWSSSWIPCYAGMFVHVGEGGFSIVANGVNTYTIPSDGILEVNTTGSDTCCANGTQNQIGNCWEEWSSDNGVTWNLVSPSFFSVYKGGGVVTEIYSVVNNQLGAGYPTVLCPQ